MSRKLLAGAAVAALVALLIWANLRNLSATASTGGPKVAAQGPSEAPLVKVQTLKPRPMTQEVLAPGILEASAMKEIRAPFTAKQVRLLVGPGDRVTAGQVLAELDATELAAQVLIQEAQVARAESTLAGLRLQEEQAPIQLAQRLEQARAQLTQAEDGLTSASNQVHQLKARLGKAQANLELLQSKSAATSTGVERARQALVQAESAYRADPLNPGLREAYDKAFAAYDNALQASEEAARLLASELRRAYDDLAAAEEAYARADGDNPAAVQLAQRQMEAASLAVQLAEVEARSGGTITEQTRAAETDLAAARLLLENLKAKLAQAKLKAPADGTILSLGLKDSQPVQETQLLLTLGNLDTMTITARVDEIDIGKVRPGQPLTARSNAYRQLRFQGSVKRVAAQAGPSTAGVGTSFAVEGDVVNEQSLLRSGMNAEVTIATDKRESTLVVGLAAVREEGGTASVLVVEDFTVKVQPVKLGLRTQTEVEILQGLKEGDQVMVGPFTLITTLKNGDPVRTSPSEEDEP